MKAKGAVACEREQMQDDAADPEASEGEHLTPLSPSAVTSKFRAPSGLFQMNQKSSQVIARANMPRANGAEAVRAVRQAIAKPFTRDDLLAAVRAALKPKAPSA